jgi:hypothetical protein
MGDAAVAVAAETFAGAAAVGAAGAPVVVPRSDLVAIELSYGMVGMVEAVEKSFRTLFSYAEPFVAALLVLHLLTRQMMLRWKYWTW